ncbi:MAG: PQQ-like beta-propeller repeat protein [Planctomycetota bacterium]|nr:PQQ-like beta-propeller repeat protein [Planctomycetota bacterium]
MISRTTHVSLTLLISAIVLGSNADAVDWPGFRGPTGDGVSLDDKVPMRWSDSENLKWKRELPGAGYSSPIVVGQRIFVTCFTNSGDLSKLTRHLVCVNRKTGEIEWSKAIQTGGGERSIPVFAGRPGYASHTPISDGERVYVLFGSSGVLAFDLTGKQIWQKSVGTESRSMFGSAASPILYKDQLIVMAGCESESLYSFNAKTGEQAWKTEAGSLSRSYSTPLVAKNSNGDDVLLMSVTNELWGMNPDNGKLRWYADTRVDTGACPRPVVHDGIVYVIGGRSGGRTAVRMGGKSDVTSSHVIWSSTGGAYVPSPVLHDGHLYWVNDSGVASCVDVKTGKEVGKRRLGGKFYGSMVLIKDKLYALSRFSGTHVLQASPEMTEIEKNKLDDDSDFSSSPAVSDGQLILRSNRNLFCIQAAD